jgi:endonuclease III
MKRVVRTLLDQFPHTYSEELGIDLRPGGERDIFKWFLASFLFGARIGEQIAKRTYGEFERAGLTTPQSILGAGWDRLVEVLDQGGYTRYDFSSASALLEIMRELLDRYGSLTTLYSRSADQKELESRLEQFKKIGPVTVNIFLRELRGVWQVDPLPSRFTTTAARNLGLVRSEIPSQILTELKKVWEKCQIPGKTFAHFETALLRLGKNYCGKNKCRLCPLKRFCQR